MLTNVAWIYDEPPSANARLRRGQCLTLTGIDELKKMVANLANRPTAHIGVCKSSIDLSATKTARMSNRMLRYKPVSLEDDWISWGIRFSLIPTSQGPYRDFCIAMQVSVPLARILGRHMFVMTVSAQTFPLCPMKISLGHGSSFAIARVLDNDHKFIAACASGDLLAVRSMLQDGQGRVNDTTDKNWTPLAVSQYHERDHNSKALMRA